MEAAPVAPTTAVPVRWSTVVATLTRPYRVTVPMVVLVSLVPLYVFIPELTRGRQHYAPAVALDRFFPLQPSWALVYGALYFFLIVLPVFVLRDDEHIRRTVFAYLTIWITAYVFFLTYPTVAPRPAEVVGTGFGAWGLRALYGADPPYNCFPSLHVAHSFVSALTCHRLHRGVGHFAIVAASLVGLSTLYTKQHYVLDVVAGVLLALAAFAVFLRSYRREAVPDLDRRLAPALALGLAAIIGGAVVCVWLAMLVSS